VGYREQKPRVPFHRVKERFLQAVREARGGLPAIEPLFFESIFRAATLTTKDPATPKGHTPEILGYLRGDLRRPIPDPLY
jgi:hypothetical protein